MLPAVDHGNIALYVPAVQCCCALLAGQVSVLLNGLVMGSAGCAVRTIGLSVCVSCAAVYRRVRIGTARGTDALFDCLRPMIAVWTTALVSEQLLRSCGRGSVYSAARSALYHACTLLLLVSGFARARVPCSEHDWQFQLAAACLVGMLVLPPAYDEVDQGPLCARPDLFECIERIGRTIAFAVLYTTMAVVEAPTKHTMQNVALTTCRATAASAWVLCVNRFVLPLTAAQMVVAIHMSVEHHKAAYGMLPIANDSDVGTDDDGDGDGAAAEKPGATCPASPWSSTCTSASASASASSSSSSSTSASTSDSVPVSPWMHEPTAGRVSAPHMHAVQTMPPAAPHAQSTLKRTSAVERARIQSAMMRCAADTQ